MQVEAGAGGLTGKQVALVVRVNSVRLAGGHGRLLAEQVGRFLAGTVRLGHPSARRRRRRVALRWGVGRWEGAQDRRHKA